jgi:hypothetical protein
LLQIWLKTALLVAATLLVLNTPLVDRGFPAGVDPQIGALSPLTVAMAAITGPSEFGFRCYWLLIWALGGLSMLVLARHLGAPHVALVWFREVISPVMPQAE